MKAHTVNVMITKKLSTNGLAALSRMRSAALTLFFALGIALSVAPLLSAHAVLVSSVPPAGGEVGGPAITMELKFNSRVDGKRSRLTLVFPDGKLYPLDIGPQNTPDTLVAPAHGLLPGAYKIRWQVLAADGHITRGEVPFTIR